VEISFWESIKSSADADDFQAYLDKYPGGQFAALAKRRLKKKPPKGDELAPAVALGIVIKDCADCPEMVILPTGIAMGKTEVTQGQWKAVMGGNPSHFGNCGDDCPVEEVNWDDTQEFIRRLNGKTGKTYRLPTEAEWEPACRAGGHHEYCGSNSVDSVAWHKGNSGDATHRVAGKQANAWGLYDMSGNVWEWVQDCWDGNCGRRVTRGGSWYNAPPRVRSDFRNGVDLTYRNHYYGFRLARMLDQSTAAKPNPVQSEAIASGPEWADSDNGSNVDWNKAMRYCASKGSGWRLPSVAELQGSYAVGQPTPCGPYECKFASKSRLTVPWFWSNEQNGSSEAWYVNLGNGTREAVDVEGWLNSQRALCVRDR
jgi:formylglycine-generating enzyme required for sulfatase activity